MQPSANMQPSTLVRVKRWNSHPRYDFICAWRQGGKRRLRYFKREKDAKAFAAEKHIELLNEGRTHGGITGEERRAVLAAREKGFALADAVAFYAQHTEALGRSTTVAVAVEELLGIREAEGKSKAHVADLRHRLRRFAAGENGGRLTAAVSTRDIDSWLTALVCGPQSRVNYRNALYNLFSFALARGYTEANPVAAATKPRVPSKPPGILSVEQMRALLHSCGPRILAGVAIAAFGGVRQAEIQRLDWANVALGRGFIEVTAASSKTGARRLVKISENLRAWLAPLARRAGPVYAAGVHRAHFAKARRAAGIAPWPVNALRHSYASYFLALHRDAAATALELGHTESRTLFRHYRELVAPEDALAYWEIFPGGDGGGNVAPLLA